MDRIKALELKRLTKELDFIETEYEYKSEIVKEVDSDFIKNVDEFLERNPELKEEYENKTGKGDNKDNEVNEYDRKEDDQKEDKQLDDDGFEEDVNEEDKSKELPKTEKKQKSKKVKKLYREIVKLTHPDKTDDKELNNLYLEATIYYEDNDIIGIYKVCNDLDIEYEMDENDHENIKKRITELKGKVKFLEATFTWNWYNAKDDKQKESILEGYIKLILKQKK